jgi:hypothetical protein
LAAFAGIAGFIHWLLTRPQVTRAFAKRESQSSTTGKSPERTREE